MPFDMQRYGDAYAVIDTATGLPALVNDVPQVGLDIEAADDLVDLLNRLERERVASTAQ